MDLLPRRSADGEGVPHLVGLSGRHGCMLLGHASTLAIDAPADVAQVESAIAAEGELDI